jgi:hypothetical protein
VLGVDTVGVSFPIVDADLTSVGVSINTKPGVGSSAWRRALPGGGWVAGGVGGVAWVEANLPKRRFDQNVDVIEDSHVPAAVVECVAEALRYVEPCVRTSVDGTTVSASDPKITRLDLVRDFQLSRPDRIGTLLDGLAAVPRDGRLDVRRYADGRTGIAETLRVGPGAWAATLYDKHAETQGSAPPGRLRFEARLRSRQLTSSYTRAVGGPITTLRDVTPRRLESIRHAWFRRAKFDVSCGTSDVWDRLAEADLSDRESLFFAGWLSARAAGRAPRLSPTTERRLRRLAAELDLHGSGRGDRVRLDYQSGCEVEEVVAA